MEAWLKCEYLSDHVGDEFDGVVSAVTSFGLFVELKDLYIEGLVHVTALPGDYYNFDAPRQRLIGERSGRSFQLGGHVRVQVARVDLDDKKIDLELVDAEPAGRKRRAGSGGDKSRPSAEGKAGKPAAAGGAKAPGSGSRRGKSRTKSGKSRAGAGGRTGQRRLR